MDFNGNFTWIFFHKSQRVNTITQGEMLQSHKLLENVEGTMKIYRIFFPLAGILVITFRKNVYTFVNREVIEGCF